MNIVIIGKTELGNTFGLATKDNEVVFSRQKDVLGNVVNDSFHRGSRAEFQKGKFIVRDNGKVVAETFGKVEITEIVIN